MKNLRYALPLLFWATLLHAQPNIEWQKSFGGSGYEGWRSVQQTSDGGYILVGDTQSDDGDVVGNHGSSDIWVVKTSSIGSVAWQKTLGGSGVEFGASIQQTSDGGYIIAGTTNSNNGDVSGLYGGYDYWIVKLSPSGEISWQKTIGGSKDDLAYSIQQTSDSGYIVAGGSNSTNGDVQGNHGKTDYWILKLSEVGDLQWQKTLGGTDDDLAIGIQQTSDKGYIIAGNSFSNDGDVSGNHGGQDFWVVRLSPEGNLVWQKALGGSGYDANPFIQQTGDGGFILSGQSGSNDGNVSGNHGESDLWVAKLNSLGTALWKKSLGGSGIEGSGSVQQTSDGGYLVAGFTNSNDGDVSNNHGSTDSWVLKLSQSGAIQWEKTFGGTDVDGFYFMKQTNEGGYIAAGVSSSTDGDATENQGFSDLWVVKLSPTVGVEDTPSIGAFGSLELFPNPSNGVISLHAAIEDSSLNVRIADLSGRQISQQNLVNGGRLDLSTLPDGVYSVVATSASGRVFANKIEVCR